MFEFLTDILTEVAANFVASTIRLTACKVQPCARRVGAFLWRGVRAEIAENVRLFQSSSLTRKVIVVVHSASIVLPAGIGLFMDDATPFAVQMWGGCAMLVLLGGIMWRATQWGANRVRRAL